MTGDGIVTGGMTGGGQVRNRKATLTMVALVINYGLIAGLD